MNNATSDSLPTVSEHFRALMTPVSLIEFWRRVRHGLQQPKDTGEYKFARLQLLRLSAWGAAIATPCIAVLLLLLLSAFGNVDKHDLIVTNVRTEPLLQPELDPVPPITPPPVPTETPVTPDESLPSVDTFIALPGPVTEAPRTLNPNAVAPTQSPLKFRELQPGGGDGGGDRRTAVRKQANTPRDDAILRALRWLQKAQLSDGSWGSTQPAMTGLALLCFLGHGELPEDKEFGPTLQKGVEWLINNQEPDGHFKGRDAHDYSQPIAAYALCEAYNVIGNPDIRYAAEKAMLPILAGQHPSGAWDYNCRQTDRDDLSYTGWCIQALKAAHLAKLGGDPATLAKALQRAAAGTKGNFGLRDGYGGFGYTSPGTPDSGLTGVGVLALQLTGNAADKETRSGLLSLDKWTFQWKQPQGASPLYYWYYVTQAKFLNGGPQWDVWDRQSTLELCQSQVVEKPDPKQTPASLAMGYWDSPAASEHHDGRVMDTCLCTLMLEVRYRYLPMYKSPAEQNGRTAPASPVRVTISLDESTSSI